jgi:hypothetical protein
MPARTNAFQRIVALVNATLAEQCVVVESAMLRDTVTDEQREVDILITASAGTYKFMIGIEVVSCGRPAGTPWVERMRARHENLPVDKLVLVSESGFTKPAEVKAKFYGIETLTVEGALNTDWGLVANLSRTGAFEVTTLRYNCALVCAFDDGSRTQIDAPLQATLQTSAGIKSLDEFVRMLIDREEFRAALYPHITPGNGQQEFWFSYTEPKGLWRLEHDGRAGQVEELRVGLHVTNRQTLVECAAGSYAGAPFVSGISVPGAPSLQFVLARTPDGLVTGKMVDQDGLRSLSNFRERAK